MLLSLFPLCPAREELIVEPIRGRIQWCHSVLFAAGLTSMSQVNPEKVCLLETTYDFQEKKNVGLDAQV